MTARSIADDTPSRANTFWYDGIESYTASLVAAAARAASASPVTATPTIALIRGGGRPASAAACAIVGAMNPSIVRGPALAGRVPSANSPVTRSARGPMAATYSGKGVAPANATGSTDGSTAVSCKP